MIAVARNSGRMRAASKRPQARSRSRRADQQKKSREDEKAYKDTLERIPNQKPADPWSKMR